MADIIERSLALSVQGEDLASDVFASVAAQIEDLEERAQTAFTGMAAYAEDAASSISDSANLITPEWLSALALLDEAASGAFSTVSGSAATAATDAAASAELVSAGWATQLAAVSEEAATTATKVDASLASVAGDSATNGETVSSVWLGNLDKIATDAATTATKVDGELDGIGGKAETNGGAVAADWSTNLDKIATDAATAAGKVDTSFSDIGGETDSKEFQGSWTGAFDKIVLSASTAAGKVDTAWGTDDGVSTTDADKFATAWTGAFDKVATEAKVSAGEVDAAFAGTGAVGGEEAAGGTTAGAAAKGEASAGTAEGEGVLGGLSVGSLLDPALMATIIGGVGLAGADMAVGGVQSVGNLAAQTGETPTQALELEMASSAQGNNPNLETIANRLEKNLTAVTQETGTVDTGSYINLGLGRPAVSAASETAVQGGGQKGAEAALTQLYGSAAAAATQLLTIDNPSEQLASIAAKLDQIKNANERSADASALFGAKGVSQVLPLLENYGSDISQAKKEVAGAGGITAGLTKELSPTGSTSMASYQEELKLGETGAEVGLTELTPVLTKLVSAIVKLEGWLEKEISPGGTVHKIVSGGLKATTGTDSTSGLTDPGKTVPDVLGSIWGDIKGAGSAVVGETSKLVGDVFGASPAEAATMSSSSAAEMAAAKKYGINPEAMLGDSYAESSLIPNRVEGSTISNPTQRTKNSTSDASGLFQFTSGTWKSDYDSLYGKDPTKAAGDYSATVQSDVAAHAMKQAGVGSSSNTGAATQSIITNFEKAGTKGDASDMSSATAFEKQLEASMTKAEADAKKHTTAVSKSVDDMGTKAAASVKSKAPEIPKAMDESLLALVKDAETHGKDFSSNTDKMLKDAEQFLKDAKPKWNDDGVAVMEGLLAGLKAEEPKLQGEAKSIANGIEAALAAALRIKSPSEMTAEMGEQLMAGLGVGLQRSTAGVASLAAGAGVHVASQLAGSASGTPGTGGGQQTIELYMDSRLIGQAVMEYTNDRTKLVAKFN